MIFLERKRKKILQNLQSQRLNLRVKLILAMTTLKLKLWTIRRRLIETARHQSLQLTLLTKSWKTILTKFVSVSSISVRVTTMNAALKKKLIGKVKSLNASLSSLWKRTKS